MTSIKPLHDRVIVKRSEASQMSSGGLHLPEASKEKPQEGLVVAVGPGLRKEDGTLLPMDLKEGDKILFGKYSGSEIKIDGETLLIMRETDIFGIVADESGEKDE